MLTNPVAGHTQFCGSPEEEDPALSIHNKSHLSMTLRMEEAEPIDLTGNGEIFI